MYLLDSFTIFYFYPRPPRGGRLRLVITYSGLYDFYPRPPRGGRPCSEQTTKAMFGISIHALREEGDLGLDGLHVGAPEFLSTPSARRATKPLRTSLQPAGFLSTPSARRATVHKRHPSRSLSISIHALREEGDQGRQQKGLRVADFYPRPPRGGRRLRWSRQSRRRDFYPRPPRGGRPGQSRPECGRGRISIHALREEGDCRHQNSCRQGRYFYPRPPRGGRPRRRRHHDSLVHFYPRPPRGGRRKAVAPAGCRR